jgi:tetratricopeptide (TPR) repeat protein
MRSKVLYGLLVLSSSTAIAFAAPTGFDEAMVQAHAAIAKFDLDSARSLLSGACEVEMSAAMPSARAAICETQYAEIEEAAGHPDDAGTIYRRALTIWNQLAPGYGLYHAATLMNFGNMYLTRRRLAEAQGPLTEAFALVYAAGREDDSRSLAGAVTSRLGRLYSDSGAPERGRPLLNTAISILEGVTPAPPPVELAYAYGSLGMLDLRTGDMTAAESSLRKALSLATPALGEDHPETAVYLSNLGVTLYLEGHPDRAVVILHRARYVAEKRLPNSFELGTILASLAVVETAVGQYPEAEADGEQSLAILSKGNAGSLEIAFAKVGVASACVHEGKIARASNLLGEAIGVERQSARDPRMRDPRVLASSLHLLGEVRTAQHNWPDAKALYSEAIAIYESSPQGRSSELAMVLREYAGVLKHSGASRADVKDVEAKVKALKV